MRIIAKDPQDFAEQLFKGNIPGDIGDYIEALLEVNFKDLRDGPFDETLGGDFLLVENPGDLDAIAVPTRYLSVSSGEPVVGVRSLRYTEVELDWGARAGEYYVAFLATNNSGGPTYFIPKLIAEGHPHVLRSINRFKGDWQ